MTYATSLSFNQIQQLQSSLRRTKVKLIMSCSHETFKLAAATLAAFCLAVFLVDLTSSAPSGHTTEPDQTVQPTSSPQAGTTVVRSRYTKDLIT